MTIKSNKAILKSLIRLLIHAYIKYILYRERRGIKMKHNKLFLALLAASSAHAEVSRRAFTELGLTEGQPKILYILKREPGPVQKELAALCGIRQSTLTVLLSKLEQQKYIYKEPDSVSGGKKAYRIHLTKEGNAMAEQLEQIVENLEEQGFTGFSIEEREQLLEMLDRVENNMKKD